MSTSFAGTAMLACDAPPLPYTKAALASAGVNGPLVSIVNAAAPYQREWTGLIQVDALPSYVAAWKAIQESGASVAIEGHGVSAFAVLLGFEVAPLVVTKTAATGTNPQYLVRLRTLLQPATS